MTNIYELLRLILQAAKVSPKHHVFLSSDEIKFLEHYLTAPDTLIQFKSYKTGKLVPIEVEDPAVAQRYIDEGYQIEGKPAEPEISYDLSLAGNPDDIFVLLSEAMMQCPNFANIVVGAARYFKEHVPTCPICEQNHPGKFPTDCPDLQDFRGWEFYKRQTPSNESKRAAGSQSETNDRLGGN